MKILSKTAFNPYTTESLISRVLNFVNQPVTKTSSPQFKGLTITDGPLILNGDLEINGKINEINSEITRIADTSLVLGVDNTLPFNQGQFAIHRGDTLPDVFLQYTGTDFQWSLFDGVTTGSVAHFANLSDNTTSGLDNFPLFLQSSTGSLVPSSTFKVPLTFQQSIDFPSGFASLLQLGIDTQLQWSNSAQSSLGLNTIDSTVLEIRDFTQFILQDGCDLSLSAESKISLNPNVDGSGTSITLSSQVSTIPSVAQSGGVDLVISTGDATTGGTLLIQSTLDTPTRSAVTVQGGQYINRGLTFGPADMVGANAPRLYTLQCPTINTLEFFGKEFVIAPSSSSLNPITSTELNLTGELPALRLSTALNSSCVNFQIDADLTTAQETAVRLNVLSRPSGTVAPLKLILDSISTELNGDADVSGNLSVGGTLVQANGIQTPSLTAISLFHTDAVYFRKTALSIPSTNWCEIRLTAELASNVDVTNSVPIGFDLSLPNRMTNFQYIGDIIVQSKVVAYDPNTMAGKDAEVTVIPLLGSTTMRVTIEADENLTHTVQLSILYETV